MGNSPKSSILIGFSIIFTIHFGIPLFLETPIYDHDVLMVKFFETWILQQRQERLKMHGVLSEYKWYQMMLLDVWILEYMQYIAVYVL